MNDPNLNGLLKWSIANSEGAEPLQNQRDRDDAARGLTPQALQELMGGPSEADLMRDSMAAILSPEITLENKMVAFDNFEQLIEKIDNANNIANMGLWTPLVSQLDSPEADLRMMAAWCVGTATQNNVKAQERVLAIGVIPKIAKMTLEDPSKAARKKAVLALSSSIRNYQPAYDEALRSLPSDYTPSATPDAENMEQIDVIVTRLRDLIAKS